MKRSKGGKVGKPKTVRACDRDDRHHDAGNSLAGIGYRGSAGVTHPCLKAVRQLIQCAERIAGVRILTCGTSHALLIQTPDDTATEDLIAIKTGFSSGYVGTGPSGFSKVIALLTELEIDLEEYVVSEAFLERLDQSALTRADLDWLDSERPQRPSTYFDYILPADAPIPEASFPESQFSPVLPYAIIDPRLMQLARSFFEDPDQALFLGFRRLESIIRKRVDDELDGAKLFRKAFQEKASKLVWNDLRDAERSGRAELFVSAYAAHRNNRFHNENDKEDVRDQLSEFLVLNHLFRLESEAVERALSEDEPSDGDDNAQA